MNEKKKLFRDHRYDFGLKKIELAELKNFLFLKSYYDLIYLFSVFRYFFTGTCHEKPLNWVTEMIMFL